MTVGVAVLNFGEPEQPTRENVVGYLERIFYDNMEIEGDTTESDARERAATLAQRRAPALIEEYEEIGGSPLQAHARTQASLLEKELRERGYDARTYVGMQFTEPFVEDAVENARSDGVDHLVGLPIYPLCGPSTNVAALERLAAAVEETGWDVELNELTGWHTHPEYTRLRAENVRSFVETRGLTLDGDTRLVFSAHGTPLYYLEEGSRYDQYVREYCEALASALGVGESELDVELREEAEEAGLDFYRVPIPYDDDRFIAALADLVEPFAAGFDPGYYDLHQCECRDAPGAFCLNAPHGR